MPPIPKGKTKKQLKAKRAREEAKVIKAVREACEKRDGFCRMMKDRNRMAGACGGASAWAHLGEWRRCHTRGMPPEERHHTKGSLMLCKKHHDAYDLNELVIEYGPDGADGTLIVRRAA